VQRGRKIFLLPKIKEKEERKEIKNN
jgi:hypothetical protein